MPEISRKVVVDEALMMRRHSLAHVMAMAVQKVIPGTKLATGPATETGFYYDFDCPEPITQDTLKLIHEQMTAFLRQDLPFERSELSINDAIEKFKNQNEPYKVDILQDLAQKGETKVSIYTNGYTNGPWFDLCRGPHVASTKLLPWTGLKLDRVSGAYWRNDEKNKMMQRVYALYFNNKEELNAHLAWREDAKKRDHRKIGQEMDLYLIDDTIGKGLPLLKPHGATIRRVLERWTIDEEIKRGYEHVSTPVLAKVDLYKISGHWDHYRESMYRPIDIDGEQFVLRPMTCPHHFVMYNSSPWSHRDLPVRYAEISPLFRYEQSGELTGLIRLRNFTLADAHIMCTQDQLKTEFKSVIDLIQYMMKTLGIDQKVWYRASLGDRANKTKYIDNPEKWEQAEKVILDICQEMDLPYMIAKDEAAFYGPKIDVQLTNVYGKEDTAFTVQIDFAMSERFDMTYKDHENHSQRPMIVHRSSIGCFERTIAFLIEHYAGKFPFWLSPVQVRVCNVNEEQLSYANEVVKSWQSAGLRVNLDGRNESLGKKIREGRLDRIPYLIVLGQKELETRTVTLRNRDTQEQKTYPLDEALRLLLEENTDKPVSLKL